MPAQSHLPPAIAGDDPMWFVLVQQSSAALVILTAIHALLYLIQHVLGQSGQRISLVDDAYSMQRTRKDVIAKRLVEGMASVPDNDGDPVDVTEFWRKVSKLEGW